MTYVRVGKQVLEFNGKNNRKNYGENNRKSHSTEETEQTRANVERQAPPPSFVLRMIDRVFQSLSRRLSTKINSVIVGAAFEDRNYRFWISTASSKTSTSVFGNAGNGPTIRVIKG